MLLFASSLQKTVHLAINHELTTEICQDLRAFTRISHDLFGKAELKFCVWNRVYDVTNKLLVKVGEYFIIKLGHMTISI